MRKSWTGVSMLEGDTKYIQYFCQSEGMGIEE